MAIGTTAAILAGAGMAASTAANLYGSKKSADASKQAAQIQQQSARDALLMAQQAYNAQAAMHSPYLSAGNNAMGMLGRLTSAPQGALFAAPPVPQVQIPSIGMPGMGPQMPSATQMRMAGSGQTPMAAQQRSPFLLR